MRCLGTIAREPPRHHEGGPHADEARDRHGNHRKAEGPRLRKLTNAVHSGEHLGGHGAAHGDTDGATEEPRRRGDAGRHGVILGRGAPDARAVHGREHEGPADAHDAEAHGDPRIRLL